MDWRQLAVVCAGAPLMLLITANYIPETPSFLIFSRQESKAAKSLQWLRGSDAVIACELATIHSNVVTDSSESCGSSDSYRNRLPRRLLKPLAICCGMMIFLRWVVL